MMVHGWFDKLLLAQSSTINLSPSRHTHTNTNTQERTHCLTARNTIRIGASFYFLFLLYSRHQSFIVRGTTTNMHLVIDNLKNNNQFVRNYKALVESYWIIVVLPVRVMDNISF